MGESEPPFALYFATGFASPRPTVPAVRRKLARGHRIEFRQDVRQLVFVAFGLLEVPGVLKLAGQAGGEPSYNAWLWMRLRDDFRVAAGCGTTGQQPAAKARRPR